MRRPDWFAVLFGLFVLGAGGYLSTFPAEIVRGCGIALMATSLVGLVIWFLLERKREMMGAYFLIAACMFSVLAALSFLGWAMLLRVGPEPSSIVATGAKPEANRSISAADLANELRGGKSYCYLAAEISARNSAGEYPLKFVNAGTEIPTVSWWPYPDGAEKNYRAPPYNPSPYEYFKGARAPAMPGALNLYGLTIKPNRYGIDFTGSNGNWRELLVISETDKETIQEITITRNGEKEPAFHHVERAVKMN